MRRSNAAPASSASSPMMPPSPGWWARCCWSSTSTGSWRAVACSPPRAWPPSRIWRHSPPCKYPSPEKGTRRPQVVEAAAPPQGAAASIAAWGPVLEPPGLHRRLLPLSTHPRFDERLDKSIVPIHRGSTRRTCASGMTASHSTLFTL